MDEEDDDQNGQNDGRRRRSIVTSERKQAFGKKNDTLNERKVPIYGLYPGEAG
jgi:hypothetical protein